MWSPKIFTALLGETGYAIWSGGDVYFVFVDELNNSKSFSATLEVFTSNDELEVNASNDEFSNLQVLFEGK